MDRALRKRTEGQYEEALAELLGVLDDYEGDWLATASVGGTYHLMRRREDALPYCRKAVEMMPRSEMASLTLFLTLYGLGSHDEAYREMFRFARDYKSREYRRLMKDLAGTPEFEEAKLRYQAS